MAKLTAKQLKTLGEFRHARLTIYDLAEILFGEKYGTYANRAGGRCQTLKKQGLLELIDRHWTITPAGIAALTSHKDTAP